MRGGPPPFRRAARPWALAALLATGSVLGATPSAGAPPPAPATSRPAWLDRLSPDAKGWLAFLEHLGWRVVVDPGAKEATYVGGAPARRASIEEAQTAGDLRLLVPPTMTAEALERWAAALPLLADGVDSRCAWQLRVAPAVESAVAKLSAAAKRDDYRFPKILVVIDSPFFTLEPPEGLWKKQGDLWVPTVKPSEAISSFWTKPSIAECFVAQTIATLAVQHELYGPEGFDEAFRPEDLGLGWVKAYYETPLGRAMDKEDEHAWRALLVHESQADEDAGMVLGRLGPKAFVGVTGILMDPGGSGRGNENYVIVSVSDAACEQLARAGFAEVKRLSTIALEAGIATRAPFMKASDIDAENARLRAAYAEPVMTGVRIYIHPYGVVTFGEMADKKRRKERTPIEANVYKGGREDAYFHRYRDVFLARWKRANPGGATSTSGSAATPPPSSVPATPTSAPPGPPAPAVPAPRRG
jgi:hypothetical protein